MTFIKRHKIEVEYSNIATKDLNRKTVDSDELQFLKRKTTNNEAYSPNSKFNNRNKMEESGRLVSYLRELTF